MNMNNVKNAFGGMLRIAVVLRYRIMGVKIGKDTFISHRAKIDTTYRGCVTIGDNCYITNGAVILAHDHSVYRRIPFSEDNGRGKVILEKNVFVGVNAIILRNVKIGENSIVSAGAVVVKDVPSNVVVAGNPARVITCFEQSNGSGVTESLR
jgi:acetyltransferase-like isoleucine patch superfamily enzyme